MATTKCINCGKKAYLTLVGLYRCPSCKTEFFITDLEETLRAKALKRNVKRRKGNTTTKRDQELMFGY